MTFSLLQQHYFQQSKHPAYTQMTTNIRAHNEEQAEMSLSILAYSVAGDSDRSDINKLDMNYTILNKCRTIIKELQQEVHITPQSHFQTNSITSTTEITNITQHMQQIITEMEAGTWTTFPISEKKYTSASPKSVHSTQRYLIRNASSSMLTLLQDVQELLVNNDAFMEYVHLVYPPEGPVSMEVSSDESN